MARVYQDAWSVAYWKGTPETLLAAAEELASTLPDTPDAPRSVRVSIEWEGGKEALYSVDAVRAASDTIPWPSVSWFHAAVSENPEDPWSPAHTVTLMGGRNGLKVSAEGPNAATVHGLVRVGEERLADGEHDRYRPVPYTTGEKVQFAIAIAIVLATVSGVVVAMAISGDIFFGFFLYFALFAGVVWPSGAGREYAPGLWLVTAEEARADKAERPGLTIRIRDWVREHPLISVLGGFTLGLLSNVVANLITG